MYITVNNELIEFFHFSGGECQIKLPSLDIARNTQVEANLTSSDHIMALLLTMNAIQQVNPNTHIELTIPYFPYARQDRVCHPGEALSINVMANLINDCHPHSVTLVDPHSDVTPALIHRCIIQSMTDIITQSILANTIISHDITLVSPDAGSEKKFMSVAKQLSTADRTIDVIYASKNRDVTTGNITDTTIHQPIEPKDYLILDDICDGGKTFIHLAKKLKEMGAKNLFLYVTHGIFSKGFSELSTYFEHIYCYHTVNCMGEIDQQFVTLLKENRHEH